MPAPQVVQLDLSKQRLFIHPDAALPKFNPRPKAVMVTPVYDYDGPMLLPVDRSSRSSSRSRGRSEMYTYAFNAAQDVLHSRRPTNKLRRRYASHSPSSRRYSLSPERYQAGHGNGGDYRYQTSQLGYVAKPGYVLARARPSTDPLAMNPPDYQVQATHGTLSAQGQSYPSYPTSQGARARPSTHPLVQGPPGYQTQATQGLPPSEGKAASQGHTAQPSSAPAIAAPLSGGRHNQLFDGLMQNYLKILPLHPDFSFSRCTGRKRALCIGINYQGQKDELKGCANDARHMRDFLIQKWRFPASEIMVLTDDDNRGRLPTRREMFEGFMWLVQGAKCDDSLFFHYSGHGGQAPDASGREQDGMDEVIFPVDHIKEGDIIDDELYQSLVRPLPAGCRLTAIFDVGIPMEGSPKESEFGDASVLSFWDCSRFTLYRT